MRRIGVALILSAIAIGPTLALAMGAGGGGVGPGGGAGGSSGGAGNGAPINAKHDVAPPTAKAYGAVKDPQAVQSGTPRAVQKPGRQ
jgi:hypothetical protein